MMYKDEIFNRGDRIKIDGCDGEVLGVYARKRYRKIARMMEVRFTDAKGVTREAKFELKPENITNLRLVKKL